MTVRVVASVIEREGKLLVCERPAHKRHGGLWEFPGGKVEEGESDFEAANQELSEELAVDQVVSDLARSVGSPGGSVHARMRFEGFRRRPRPMPGQPLPPQVVEGMDFEVG